ncbi:MULTISPECIES: TIGR03435 family protein [Acidobacteriaceae]|uniref:TIGR03435 family protein n=1 Tax=Acidobacteriaceae TaxID=204434 RepID=UPI00131E8ED9|nr:MULTISPECIES: TIGR03435 family protein [Acidobacteriaceae]MDW5267022.1 TIGR03435 family protein [Edaphobacter sp.]
MANLLRCKSSSVRKLLLFTFVWMVVAAPVTFAQAGAVPDVAATTSKAYVPTLTFDVASIRQSPAADSYMVSGSFAPHSSSLRVTDFDAMNLLSMAYGVRWDQISGMPNWSAMFNIQAKSDSAADERLAKLSKAQERLEQQHMMQALLADRFKLKAHWETREGPAYDLVLSKNGSKMQEAKGEPPSAEERKAWGDYPIPPLYQRGDSRVGFDYVAHGCSMNDIVQQLAAQFGHPVVDKTGLTGKYDFTLRYHGTRLSDRKADDMDPIQPLDIAIQEQLGLKLKPTKGSVQMLVIDHIEKPSEN